MAEREVQERTKARIKRARETIAMIQLLRREPSRGNIAAFHELHARHLRELGEDQPAIRVDERARAERARHLEDREVSAN